MNLPTIPTDCKADLIAARVKGQFVFIRELSQINGECPNCGGQGFLWFQFASGGAHKSPSRQPCTFVDGSWYEVETKVYACPVCTDKSHLVDYLWRRSGLEPNEINWRLEYYEGMDGKDHPMTQLNALLSETPRPIGWMVLTGDYGRGKSGMLKCVTAAFIRAGVPARYMRAADMLLEIRSTYGDNLLSEDESELRRQYAGLQVLCIDEVDRIGASQWSQDTMMVILDTRYQRRESVVTLLASNLDPENMPVGLGYLASRMRDGARLRVRGKDLRG